MKNIHILPTDKPSRLGQRKKENFELDLVRNGHYPVYYYNIYITSDEPIKEGDWLITLTNDVIQWAKILRPNGKKIILTTDQDLIKDGVQAIDDEFLEWFVINPSCKFVEIHTYSKKIGTETDKNGYREMNVFGNHYKIIIPQEEPKQETLEEAAEIEKAAMDKLKSKWSHLYTFGYPQRPFPTNYENDLNNIKVGLYEGAKWQSKKMYSEEEVFNFAQNIIIEIETRKQNIISNSKNMTTHLLEGGCMAFESSQDVVKELFEQFKKK